MCEFVRNKTKVYITDLSSTSSIQYGEGGYVCKVWELNVFSTL